MNSIFVLAAALFGVFLLKKKAEDDQFKADVKASSDAAYDVGVKSTDWRVITNSIIVLQENHDPRAMALIAYGRSLGMNIQ